MLRRGALALSSLVSCTWAHDHSLPVNVELGVPGFPDCRRSQPEKQLSVAEAAADLVCSQRAAFADSIKIACVGDSITAGVHSSSASNTYPAQLQMLLDKEHGAGKFEVTNLGACGSTMQKNADSPFWKRSQYPALTGAKWDVVIIMLGTNDAKDSGSHGPDNWKHDCGGDLASCTYAQDYAAFIDVVRGLGRSSAGPTIWTMIPPPLMQLAAYGMNSTVINTVFPRVIRDITKANYVSGPVDLYAAMGGVADWSSRFPKSCSADAVSAWPDCKYFCDAGRSNWPCDQCHPGDAGYQFMASWIKDHVFGAAEATAVIV
eukprot:TRINITY_DN34163_c0_g1_i1.p1 TRINITY_DN34163_c0_g1~~TRINITY_DN34163_c0_g1_i1.p1  ORF type:complete len:318 (-),score=53.79 TRINITY_DN34163_c0_g1_i1:181-1134(-)